MGNYGLQTIYSFEPFAQFSTCKGFPIYQTTSDNIDSVYSDITTMTSYTSEMAVSSPIKCNNDEYWAGTSCKPTNILMVAQDVTPGLVIPIKTRLSKNMEWTIETWVYVVQDADSTIASIEGDNNCKLSIRSNHTYLIFDWLYGSTGLESIINTPFTYNTWHYVSLTARLDTPNYVAEASLDLTYSNTSNMIIPSVKQN